MRRLFKTQDHQITLIRIYTICMMATFMLPIIVPYYHQVIGLSFRDFLIGEAVFSAVVILGEVPSGYLSDIWRRKHVLALGVINTIIGYILLLIARDFWIAVLAQGVIGIGVSLCSGTVQAIMYDHLLSKKEEGKFRQLEGQRLGLGMYALAIGAVLGGLLYQSSPFLPLIMDVAIMIIGLAAALMLQEPPRTKTDPRHSPLQDIWDTAKYALHGHKDIAGIILFSAILFAGSKILLWAQQPYYLELGLPEYIFGFLIAGGALLGGLGGQFGHKLDGRMRNRSILGACLGLLLIACVTSGSFIWYHGVLLLMSGSLIWGIGSPHVQDAINIRVGSERRATILSTASLMVHILFIPLSFVIGWIDEGHGIGASLIGLAGIVGGLALLFRFGLWRNGTRRR